MDKMQEKYLPLGSVVLLKKAKKRIMITGYAMRSDELHNKIWDYIGCLYPEGVQSSNKNLLFDHKDISDIYSIGYCDDEHKRYLKYLVECINSDDKIEND